MKNHKKSYPKNLSKREILVTTVQKLSLARNIEEVMQIVRTVARELTGADGATFVLRDGNFCYYADEDAISPLWKGSRFPIETCISGWAMMNKKPAVIEDIYKDDRIPVDAYKPTFVKSLVTVPIRTLEPIGAIGNYWAEHRMPSEEEVSILQALADITSVSIENIEVRNKLEEKLEERTQMVSQLKKQKEQLEEFTYIIAHNMRAPLSNLLLLTDMVEKSDDTDKKVMLIEKQKPILDFLHQTFEDLVNAIHVKMDYSVEKNVVDLNQCFDKSLNLLQGEVIETNAKVTCDFSNAKTAHFPQSYLENVMFNLLSNALRYHSPKRKPQINIRSYKENDWTYIEVEDNGLGIDLKQHDDKIFMLQKTFHNHPKAKGFGLFLVKSQVEAMDGEVSVKSIPDKGSTFTVKLNKNK